MTQQEELTFGEMVNDSAGDNIPGKPRTDNPQILKLSTDESQPNIVKLTVDPRRPKESYYRVMMHKHMVGSNQRNDNRLHLCQKQFGRECPECEEFWKAAKKCKEMRLKGDDKSPEFEKMKNRRDKFRQSERFWVMVVTPDSDRPRALLLVKEAIDRLFGVEAKFDKPAQAGLVYTMKDKGRSPFNLKSDKGWLKIFRSGEPPKVSYNISEHFVEMEDGSMRPATMAVSSKLFETKIKDIPDLSKQNENQAWTMEESLAFVKGNAEVEAIPDRLKRRSNQAPVAQAPVQEDDEIPEIEGIESLM
jgi:hypothetical protein